MAKNEKEKRFPIFKFVALALLLYYFGGPLIMAVLTGIFGPVPEIINKMVDLIPFGESYYAIAIQVVNSILGEATSNNIKEYFTISYVLQNLAKELFTVVIFEAATLSACIVLGLADSRGNLNPKGAWEKIEYYLITVIIALASACLAPIPLEGVIFSRFHTLESSWQSIISLILSVVLVGGGIAFFLFLYSFSIGKAIAFVFIKFLLLGTFRISVCYLAILVYLIGEENRLFLLSAGGVTSLLALGIMLVGIEMVLKSAFAKHEKEDR